MIGERRLIVTKVVDHRHILKGEVAENQSIGDCETRGSGGLPGQGFKGALWIERRRVAPASVGTLEKWEEIVFRQCAAKVGLQDIQKHWIDGRITRASQLE